LLNYLDSFSVLFQSRIKLQERLQCLIVSLGLVQVMYFNIEGDGDTNIEKVFFLSITEFLELVEQGCFF
jgi:hypothetical protein